VCGGKPIPRREAAAIGLVDRVAGDALAGRWNWPQAARGPRRTAFTAAPVAPLLPRRRRRSARAWPRPRGAQAPLAALDALLNTLTLPLDEGLVAEQTIFQACNAGAEARALQHMFLAERKVAQVKGIDRATPARAIGKLGVVGAGTMGSGIAAACLAADLSVVLVDLNPAGLERGAGAISKTGGHVAKGRLSEAAARNAGKAHPCGRSGRAGRCGSGDRGGVREP
jgi:3-hydroxyacyl-CoA dehydrogenase